MPRKQTVRRARADLRAGKSPTTAAGEFVREEIEHVREGKHGARSTKQAIAIGLSKARRAGVPLKPPAEGTSRRTRKRAARDTKSVKASAAHGEHRAAAGVQRRAHCAGKGLAPRPAKPCRATRKQRLVAAALVLRSERAARGARKVNPRRPGCRPGSEVSRPGFRPSPEWQTCRGEARTPTVHSSEPPRRWCPHYGSSVRFGYTIF